MLMFLLPMVFIYIGVIAGKTFVEDFGEATDGIKIFFVGIFIV